MDRDSEHSDRWCLGTPLDADLFAAVESLVGEKVRRDVRARDVTTFALGGPISALITVQDTTELAAVVKLLDGEGQQVRILGNGSNLLVSDQGPGGWVVKLGSGFRRITRTTTGLFCLGAATSLMSAARKICAEGYSGLEFAGGIPASVGGAVFMNAGAHGSEICERTLSVRGLRLNGEEVEWAQKELAWRYRHSGIPSDVVVTEVLLALEEGDAASISAKCEHCLQERRARQPLHLPSAGSVFKNPSSDMPAGKLLEACGAKGFSIGGVQVSELHANWIVNPDKLGKAEDVLNVIRHCQSLAEERGIHLEPEVRMWDLRL